ncbi:uncharacterized protein LOC103030825 [Astyanax mexicanus]|uniref:uncharacterized protein LOC103030825 n=1 Tax=Astyanax mexicanus TaxID=7994 RepID=UPI0020CB2367|nr:uncharacterized protein LOC103030825 [Astyanax mexicanus]
MLLWWSGGGMNAFERKLAELVRSYPHLYDRSRREFRDVHVFADSWREIANKLGGDDPVECKVTWSNLRKKFSKARKRMICRSGGRAKDQTPKRYKELSWLNQFVHHRHIPTDPAITLTGPPITLTGPPITLTGPPITLANRVCESLVETTDPSFDTSMNVKLEQPEDEREPFDIVCIEDSPSCSSTAESSSSMLLPSHENRTRRRSTTDSEIAKMFCELERFKAPDSADAHDRYVQTIADFMRGLSRIRCAHFKKRVNDIMYEMELEQLHESGL